MNPLEKETLKYEKKGFKIAQRRTLKYGSRRRLEMYSVTKMEDKRL